MKIILFILIFLIVRKIIIEKKTKELIKELEMKK